MFAPMTSVLPLVRIQEDIYRYVLKASDDGQYVGYDKTTSQYTCGPKGLLSGNPAKDEERGKPWLRIEDENDISTRLGSAAPVYTMNVGIAYEDGSCGGLFVFEDAVVEYRNNIGKSSSKTFSNRSAEIGYMITYAGVGIKTERFDWIVAYLELAGIAIGDDEERPFQHHNGYTWITANITANTKPQLIIRDAAGLSSRADLVTSLASVGKNIIGYLFATMTLRRVNTSNGVKHRIGLSLKGFQAVDITEISSPPLNKVGTINSVAGAPTSAALMNIFASSGASAASGMPTNRNALQSSVAANATSAASNHLLVTASSSVVGA